MPKECQVLFQSCRSQYRNDEDFTDNTGGATNYLAGLVGENVQMTTVLEVIWFTEATPSAPLTLNMTANIIIERSMGSFLDDSFRQGDTVVLNQPGFPDETRTVLFVSDTQLALNAAPTNQQASYTDLTIYGVTPLEGLVADFGLLENNEPTNYLSKIDGNPQSWYVQGIVSAAPSFVDMDPLNGQNVQSWVSGGMEVRFDGLGGLTGFSHLYTIIHEFTVLPYFVEGWDQFIIDGTLPPLFNGTNTLKYVLQSRFKPNVNNPNDDKVALQDQTLGNVGFFEQTILGGIPEYNVTDVEYYDVATGNPVPALQVNRPTRIEFNVNSDQSVFDGTSKIYCFHSYLPDQVDYANNLETVKKNFLLYGRVQEVGGGPLSDGSMTNLEITANSANQLSVQFVADFSAADQNKIDQTKNYAIGVVVGDPTRVNANDDRALLRVDYNTYEFDTDVPGMVTVTDGRFRFFEHPWDPAVASGTTDFKSWVEEGHQARILPIMDFTIAERILSISFRLGLVNDQGEGWFTDEYGIGFTGVLDPSGAQLININNERSFNLLTGDPYKAVSINTIGVGKGFASYDIRVAFKVNWEEWKENLGVDTVFYDVNEPNFNLNNDISNKVNQNGYRCVAMFDFQMRPRNGADTTYRFISPACEVLDYDDDGFGAPGDTRWSAQIETFDASGSTNLNGLISSDEDTLFRTTYTPVSGSTADLVGLVGVNRLDIRNGGIGSIYEHSTVWPPLQAQPLKALPFENLTTITDTGSEVILECLIDKDEVEAGSSYRLSSQLWGQDKSLVDERCTEEGDDRITENETQEILRLIQ